MSVQMDTRDASRKAEQTSFGEAPFAWALATEVTGLDLSRPETISDEVIERLRRLVGERCVLVFRNQTLTHDQHLAFTRRFGPLAETGGIGRYAPPGYPDIFTISNLKVDGVRAETAHSARQWHTDQSHMPLPAMGSMLYCIEAPALGGDTVFGSLYRAYETLSEGLRRTLETLSAVHTLYNPRNTRMAQIRPYDEDERKNLIGGVQPLVKIHPITGRKALYYSDLQIGNFEGWTVEESRPLIEFLHRHCIQHAFTYRHRWRPGDLVFWDNRCTIHHAPADYDTDNMDAPENRRLMYRTTLAG